MPTWRSEVNTNTHRHTSQRHAGLTETVTSRAAGEPQQNPDDDAPTVYLSGEEELPLRHPGGVQTVGAPAQPEGPGSLAAGEHLSVCELRHAASPRLARVTVGGVCVQVDNQLPGAIFPIVFHPVPPPKSIALDSGGRPPSSLSTPH